MTGTTPLQALVSLALVAAVTVAATAPSVAQSAPPRPVLTAAPAADVPAAPAAPALPAGGATAGGATAAARATPPPPPVQGFPSATAPDAAGSSEPEPPPLSGAGLTATADDSPAVAPLTGTVRLADVLAEADIRNPDLAAARSLVASARARVVRAAGAPLQLVVQPALTQDVPGGIGTIEQLSAGFTQQVSPGVALARAVAGYDVTLASGLAEATSRDVRGRVVDAYYALASAQARVVAGEQSLRGAVELVAIARRRERAGAVGGFEVLRAVVEARRAQSELAQARSSLRQSSIALGALVGRPVEPTAALPLDAQPGLASTQDAASVVELALTRDPTSAQLRATLARSSARLAAARALRRPALSVAAGYLVQRAPNLGDRISSGVTASLGVSLPVVDFGTIRGAELEARADAATALAQIAGRELQLRASIAAAREAVESSRARFDFAGESSLQAERSLRIARFGFSRGALGTLDVISARTAATAARTERDQARGDYAAAVAKLRILLGDPIAP